MWGGVQKTSLIYRYFHRVSQKIYQDADKILVTSRMFSNYFQREFHLEKTKYLPQYAEDIFDPASCRKEEDGYLDLMFAGNMGIAQGLPTIVEAAAILRDEKRLRWHFVGDGSEVEQIRDMVEKAGLSNVFFHGRKPLEEMPKYYAMADAMIVSMQKMETLSYTLPGKVQTYMAAGKPVIGSIDGEAAEVIRSAQCGVCSDAEDAAGLSDNIRRFLSMDKKQLGLNARDYYEKNFAKAVFMKQLKDELNFEG